MFELQALSLRNLIFLQFWTAKICLRSFFFFTNISWWFIFWMQTVVKLNKNDLFLNNSFVQLKHGVVGFTMGTLWR